MEIYKNNKLIISSLFAITLFAGFFPFSKAEAAWLTGWGNRRAITIDNTAGSALSNYQVGIDTTNAIYNENGLVSSWHLNEGSGTGAQDSSGNSNYGTLVNTPTWLSGASCKFGSCLQFNGINQTISVSDNPEWSFSGDFSISTWIKWNGTPGATSIMGQDQGGGANPKWILGWNNTLPNVVSFHIQTAGVNIQWNWQPSANTWYHMVVLRNGNYWYLYINGEPIGVPQVNATIIPSISAPLTIGSDGESWKWFNGWLDELRIYNRALSVTEISDLYNGTKARLDYGDVRFTNDDGSTLIDHWQESDKKSWVEVPSISAASQKTIYMYYGKSDATSVSNGTNTFDFFDDFNGASLDTNKWITTGAMSASLVSGAARITSSVDADNNYFAAKTFQISNPPGQYSMRFRNKVNQTTSSNTYGFLADRAYGVSFQTWNNGTDYASTWPDGTAQQTAFGAYNTSYHIREIRFLASNSHQQISDEVVRQTGTGTFNNPAKPLKPMWFLGGGTQDIDWIYVFKRAVVEPTISLYAEQANLTYSTRRAITIDNTGTASTLYDYQIPIDLANSAYNNIGLVGSWHLDDGQGTSATDSSGNINNATWYGTGSRWSKDAKFGAAGIFNAATLDYVRSASAINIGNNFTIEFWMKPTNLHDYGDPVYFGTADFGATFVTYANGSMNFAVGNSYNAWGNSITAAAGTLANNNWYHVVGIANGSNIELFVNGVSKGIAANSNAINSVITIGARTSLGYYFTGLVDEVKVYTRPISVTEISDHYLATKARLDNGDLRFTDSAEYNEQNWTSSYSYWLESDKKAWVKIPSIAASAQKTIYMYYGNSSATGQSNGYNTYNYFDDGTTLSSWNISGATTSLTEGNPSSPAYSTYFSSVVTYMNKDVGLKTNSIVEYNQKLTGAARAIGNFFFLSNYAGVGQAFNLDNLNGAGDHSNWYNTTSWTGWGVSTDTGFNPVLNTWYRMRLVLGSTSAQMSINETPLAATYNFSNNGGFIGLVSDGGNAHDSLWDNIRIRKYTAIEPPVFVYAEQNNLTYTKRRAITIDNTTNASALYNYQLPVDLVGSFYDSAGLMGSWHFNEGEGPFAKDSSGNGNSGIFYGSPAWNVASNCKFGNCVNFNGASTYVNVPSNLGITNGDITISAWIKPTTATLAGDHPAIVSHYDNSAKVDYRLFLGATGIGVARHQPGIVWGETAQTPITAGQWYYVNLVYSGSTLSLYINNVFQRSITVSGAGNSNTTTQTFIGCGSIAPQTCFNGIIDEVRIYNRALSATEINNIYTAPSARLDLADIRFSDSTNYNDQNWTSSYSYWLESDKKVWVRIPSVAASTQKTIYMYYGNTSANDNSDLAPAPSLTSAASGGTITYTDSRGLNPRSSPAYSGGYTVHTFTTSGTFTSAGGGNIETYAWGGGGGGGTPGGWVYGAAGGAGGAAQGNLKVFFNTPYVVTVGGGGGVNSYNGTLTCVSGGGACASWNNSDNRYGSGGGGYSGLFLKSVSQYNALLLAAGGGGGGSSRAGTGNIGGAGGGSVGENGSSPYDGKISYRGVGGSQISAGTDADCVSPNTTGGQTALLGGRSRINSYGGAGGGGYWGGSGGGYSEANTMGGGAGGSGYANPALSNFGVLIGGSGTTPGDATNSLRGSAGNAGGVSTAGTAGVVIIRYKTPAVLNDVYATLYNEQNNLTYSKRRAITIDNTANASALYDYQVSVDLTNGIYNNDGLVGSWHLNEGSGSYAYDASGKNRIATWLGTANYWTGDAKAGTAGTLNGSDNRLGIGTWFNYQQFTISLWVKPGTTQQQYADLFDNNHTGAQNFVFQQNSTVVNQYTFGTLNASASCSTGVFNLTASTWQYVTAVREAGAVKVYVNGVEVASATANCQLPITYTSPSLYFGGHATLGRYWNGQMDEIRAYSRALSSVEILDLYNASKSKLDYSDIRFSDDIDYNDVDWDFSYSYWLESDKKAWVRVPTVAANTQKTIYMYYGNSNATGPSPLGRSVNGTITYTDSSGLNPRSSPSYAGGYTVHTFTTSGIFKLSNPSSVDSLVVAGGGGGAGTIYGGGGGGAGGVIYRNNFKTSLDKVDVIVGAGGASRVVGGDSFFGDLKAFGGGPSTEGQPTSERAGGSGGGGGHSNPGAVGGYSTQDSNNGGTGYGNAGGTEIYSSPYPCGSGGGAGGAGCSGCAGGVGIAFSISGTSIYYAGGGGQSSQASATAGGNGGGGAGGFNANAASGVANTGGGGGGSYRGAGGVGGSGIVIVRYKTPSVVDPTTYLYGEQSGATFTTKRDLTINNTSNASALYNYQIPIDLSSVIFNNSGLIGSWHMDKGFGTLFVFDTSDNKNHGTLINNTSWLSGSNCKFGSCTGFNGTNNYIDIANSTLFDVTNLTINAWVYSSNFSQRGFIFEKGAVNSQYACFFEDGYVTFRTLNSSSVLDDLDVSVSVISNNNWHNLSCVYDGATKKIYVDGAEVGSKAYTQTLRTGQTGERIGAYGGGTPSYYFNGRIDEVRVYNRALTSIEILDLYNATKAKINFDDIRFSEDGSVNNDQTWTNSLSYWIESDKRAWLRVPYIPASSNKTIYMYYGSSSAASQTNGNNTFEFFDEFADYDLSRWYNACGAYSTNGLLHIPSNTSCDTVPMYIKDINLSDSAGYNFEVDGEFVNGSRLQIYQRRRNDNGYIARFWISGAATTNYQEYTGTWSGAPNVGANNMLVNTWYRIKTKVNGTNNSFYVNDTLIGSSAASASLSSLSNLTVGLGEYSSAVYYDDARIRKYTSTEPTITLVALAINCGLKGYDGSATIAFGCEPSGTLTSALRMYDGSAIYGIKLVDTTDPNATKFRVQTSGGTKAIMKCDPASCTTPEFVTCGDNISYGGESYPTVQIGTQCWFAKDLNVGTRIAFGVTQGTDCSSTAAIKKYCYGDLDSNCTTYGAEYQWAQAMCGSTTENAQGICPTGWHIPKDPEWVALTNYLGGTSCGTYRSGNSNVCGGPAGDRMKTAGLCYGRTPCGNSGFNALFGGADSAGLGNYVIWWTSSPYSNGTEAWRANIADTSAYLNGQDVTGVDGTYYYSPRTSGRHIRCVKN